MTSRDACPAFDVNSLFTFLDQYKFFWGLLFIFKGLVANFFGRKSIKHTVFLVSFLSSTLGLMLFIYTVLIQK
jgi:hypothetical protein